MILPLVDETGFCVWVLAWLGVDVKTIPTTKALTTATTLATISLFPSKGGSNRASSRLKSNV